MINIDLHSALSAALGKNPRYNWKLIEMEKTMMETLYIGRSPPFHETLKGKERRANRFSIARKGEKGDKRKENWGRRCSMASKNKLIVWSKKENIIFLCVCLAIDVEAERQYNLFRINIKFQKHIDEMGKLSSSIPTTQSKVRNADQGENVLLTLCHCLSVFTNKETKLRSASPFILKSFWSFRICRVIGSF